MQYAVVGRHIQSIDPVLVRGRRSERTVFTTFGTAKASKAVVGFTDELGVRVDHITQKPKHSITSSVSALPASESCVSVIVAMKPGQSIMAKVILSGVQCWIGIQRIALSSREVRKRAGRCEFQVNAATSIVGDQFPVCRERLSQNFFGIPELFALVEAEP